MATDIDHHTLGLTIVRLRTSIEYHIFFLAVTFFIGVTLSIYIIRSMNNLQDGLSEARTYIMAIQKDIEVMKTENRTTIAAPPSRNSP